MGEYRDIALPSAAMATGWRAYDPDERSSDGEVCLDLMKITKVETMLTVHCTSYILYQMQSL